MRRTLHLGHHAGNAPLVSFIGHGEEDQDQALPDNIAPAILTRAYESDPSSKRCRGGNTGTIAMRKKVEPKKQKCKNCEGRGTLKKGDKVVRCQRCGGTGVKR